MNKCYTGAERRIAIEPNLVEFVQVGDEVYDVNEVIDVVKKAGLTNRKKGAMKE